MSRDWAAKDRATRRKLSAAGQDIRRLEAQSQATDFFLAKLDRPMSARRGSVRSRRGTMARARGGDVVVRLLHEVGQFREMVDEHATRLTGLEKRMDALADQMSAVSTRMDSISGAMSDAGDHIQRLASHAKAMSNQLGKVSKSLAEAAQQSEGRFAAIEQRLSRLEAKA